MANEFEFLSPGIQIREIDQSAIPAETADDGPIIIGRTRKGPAMEPVRVRSLDAFIRTFGTPVPGGVPANVDVWRDGPNTSAPTYASYAAQAWLASGNGPCTIVRLLGDHTSKTKSGNGEAGWQLSSSMPKLTVGENGNSTAYGLFIIDSASCATTSGGTGSLAAVFYVDRGYLGLKGIPSNAEAAQAGGTVISASHFIKSNGNDISFAMNIYDESSAQVGSTVNFNFNRTSPNYIRNVFNTNPQKVNTSMNSAATKLNYWLGETFERHLKTNVTTNTTGLQLGALVALHVSGSKASATGNWGYRREKHTTAKTGYIISKDNGAHGSYSNVELLKNPLFRFCSLHGGDDMQKEIMIAIEDIRLPSNSNVDAFASFSVCILDVGGNVLEKFTRCNLDKNSRNYIVRRIGDTYAESWDDDSLKYNYAGNEPNRSSYVRVELAPDRERNGFEPSEVPFGFAGPEIPYAFKVKQGQERVFLADPDQKSANETASNDVFVVGSGSIPIGPSEPGVAQNKGVIAGLDTDHEARFKFPSIPLRISGSDGGATNPFKVYWGIRPKISQTSTVHDVDYVDYIRAVPSAYKAQQHSTAAGTNFKHSFIFSLDDIKIDTTTNIVTYVSGSRKVGNSYTATNGANALIDKKVRQFVMPMYGGRHGFDVTEVEPLRNTLIQSHIDANGTDEGKSSELYTVFKAINTVADPEVVPGNILVAPGFYQSKITDRILTTAQTRQDVLAIIDLEDDYKSEYETLDDIATRRGSVTSAKTSIQNREFDNTYGCAFYPAVQITDPFNNNARVWVPSSVAGLGGIAQSEAATAPWFAPAGFNRGGLGALGGSSGPVVTMARQRLDSDDRDTLYELNVNPIATFPNEGVVIFGQKTLQAASDSALSRINVRRLLIYLKTRISAVATSILFDQNVPATWARFTGQAEPILADVKARFGLTDYKLVLDETTTTAELIDKNVLYAQVYLKPARAIEFIAIDFIITRTGASFV